MDDGELGQIKFAYWHIKCILDHEEDLVTLYIPNVERQQMWLECLSLYCWKLYQQKDFTDEEIDSFQNTADSFFIAWLQLVGHDRISNYFNMLGAGHFR